MADFTYASSNNQKYWKDQLSNNQKGLAELDQLEKQTEYYAQRAQDKLASLPADSPDRAKYESVLRSAEENRIDIANNRARIRETIDDVSKNIDDQVAARDSASNNTAENQVNDRESVQPLSEQEQSNLTRIRSDNDSVDLAAREAEGFTPDENPENYGYGIPGQQSAGGNSQGPKGPTPNILDRYPNYTYGISLHYMPIKKYNDVLVRGVEYTTSDNTVLIASGGRRTAELARNPVFSHDMYFEDFKMNCVIGHNAKTRGSNAIDITFTVVEPLGMTLLDKILQVADQAGIRQWDQMPFVIQIDFFANEESGRLATPVPGATKRICVKIIDMQIKIQPKGATYRITAIPQSHVSFLQTNSATPANFEVMAKKVKDFFASSGDVGEFESAVEGAGREEKKQIGQKKTFKIYSYAAALNSFQEQLKKLKHQETADVYKFEFDSEIGEAEIFVPERTPMNRAAAQNDNNQNTNLDREKGMIPVNAGTYVKEVINLILRASKYYRDQIEDKSGSNEMEAQNSQYISSLGNTPIKSHKITTKVEYGAWDDIRKVYQKTMTFKVEKYTYYNTKYPEAVRGIPSKWDKEYYYMYTGKNQQIIDFDIDFNTMFFTVLTAMEKRYQYDRVQTDKQSQNQPDNNAETGEQQIQVSRPLPVINLAQDAVQLSTMDKKYVEATDLFKSMMSNSRGDMINVSLKITGDPELIKQDDVFSSLNGSLPMDKQELFVKLEFRLPEDIDQNTGLYKIDKRSIFSGIYKMIAVNNVFERGQFTQTLELIRMFDQPDDRREGSKTSGSSIYREEGLVNNATLQLPGQASAASQLRASIAATPALSYTNFRNTGAGEFGEELNMSNFKSTGAGEFGEETRITPPADLKDLRNQESAPADLNDFFG